MHDAQSSAAGCTWLPRTAFIAAAALVAAGCGVEAEHEIQEPGAGEDESAATASTTVAFQRGVAPAAGYQGAADATLYESAPDAPAGASASLLADADYPASSGKAAVALVRFDLRAIPPGSAISAATLTLNVTNKTSGSAFGIYPLLRPWAESQATWKQSGTGQAWGTEGARAPSDRGSTPLATLLPTTTGKAAIPISAAGLAVLSGWVDAPASNFGFAVDAINNMDGLGFDSSEAAVLANRPALSVTYAPAAASAGKGLLGQYYSGTSFETLVAARIDPALDFSWAGSAPAPGVPATSFSVRWTGKVEPLYSETYTVSTLSDDGIRVWVNGQKVIDRWTHHSAAVDRGTIALAARQRYDLKVEYFQGVGQTRARLSWSSPSQAEQVIPPLQLYPASGSNEAPKASFTWASNGLSPSFDASASTDSDGSIAGYAWDFGDGKTGTGKAVTHTFAAPGAYSVRLTVTDNLGATASASKSVTASNAEKFTLVVLPDTQSEMTNTPQVRWPAMVKWIVDNKASRNIKFVAQVGDLVNWDTPNHFMWVNADAGFDQLDAAGIPYAIALGNHDTAAVGGKNPDGTPCYCSGSAAPGDAHENLRNTTTFNTFFPVSRFPTCRGRYAASKMDNAYHTFSAGGLNWLVVSTELDPRQGALDWVKGVVQAHPNHNVIYVTHNYLAQAADGANTAVRSGGCGYGDLSPAQVWTQLLSQYSNVKLVLAGHLTEQGRREDLGVHGNRVYQMLTDWQNLGQGWMRTIEIDPVAKSVTAKTFSPYLNQSKTDSNNEFTLQNVAFVPPS